MPLPPSAVSRQPMHVRSIRVEAFARDDGLWDIEAHLTDIRPVDTPLATGVRAAGDPVHSMWLRLTVDKGLNVLAALADSDRVPYPGECERITPDYAGLVGLNLMRGFRHGVRERLAGRAGCTHMTELASVLPTAAIQAFAGQVFNTDNDSDKLPFQLDRCHALRLDGENVRLHYPKWYRPRDVTPREFSDFPPGASG